MPVVERGHAAEGVVLGELAEGFVFQPCRRSASSSPPHRHRFGIRLTSVRVIPATLPVKSRRSTVDTPARVVVADGLADQVAAVVAVLNPDQRRRIADCAVSQ